MDLTNKIVERNGFKRINNSMWRLDCITLQNAHTDEGGDFWNRLLTTRKAYKVCLNGKYLQMIWSEDQIHQLKEKYIMETKEKQEKGLQKVANHLGEQMTRLVRTIEKPSYEDLKGNHIKSIRCLDNIIEIDDRIARQRVWLRSNLNASPEEKSKVKSRLDEMKKAKSELIDEYTQLQLP